MHVAIEKQLKYIKHLEKNILKTYKKCIEKRYFKTLEKLIEKLLENS